MYSGIPCSMHRNLCELRIRNLDTLTEGDRITIIRSRINKETHEVNYSMTTDCIIKCIQKEPTGLYDINLTLLDGDKTLYLQVSGHRSTSSDSGKFTYTSTIVPNDIDHWWYKDVYLYYVVVNLILEVGDTSCSIPKELPCYGISEEDAIDRLKRSINTKLSLGSDIRVRKVAF